MKKALRSNLTFAVANQGRSFFRLVSAGSVMLANTYWWLPPIAPKLAKIALKGTKLSVKEDPTSTLCQASGGALRSLTILSSAGMRTPASEKAQEIIP